MSEFLLFAEAQDPAGWSASQIMGVILWVGLALLTLALVILGRTRWGQTQPLAKCVALSVFAHVLLCGYAYGTKLIFTVPVAATSQVAALKVVPSEPEDEIESEPLEVKQQSEPWNQFTPTDTDWEPSPEKSRVEGAVVSSDVPGSWDSAPIAPSNVVPDGTVPQTAERAELPLGQVAGEVATQVAQAETIARESPTVQPPAEQEQQEETSWLEQELPSLARPDAIVDASLPVETLSSQDRLTLQEVFDSPTEQAGELLSGIEQLLDSTLPQLPQVDPAVRQNDSALPLPGNAEFASQQRKIEEAIAAARTIGELLTQLEQRRRLGDGQALPEMYQLRQSEHRPSLVVPLGGTPDTERAVEDALSWLAANQEADGRWDASRHQAGIDRQVLGQSREGAGAQADCGVTGLALLAFLAGGHTHLEGEYRETVQRGLEYLIRSQASDGNLYGEAALFARMYCHGMAALALSEALAMTGDARLREAVESAIQYSRYAQHPQSGGWRYLPQDKGDMSQFGWQVMALRSAEQAGIAIPESTRLGMHRFIDSVSQGSENGLCSYRPNEAASPTMTAEGLTCRYFLNYQHLAGTVDEATEQILLGEPREEGLNLYFYYYATLALYQRGGPQWERWNQTMQRELLASQVVQGADAGCWPSDTRWGGYGGKVYSTAMGALCLEVYYRYLPLYRLEGPTATGANLDREARIRIPGAALSR